MLPFSASTNVCEPHRFTDTTKRHPRTHAPSLQVQGCPGERSPWQHPHPSPAGRGWTAPCQGIRAHLPGSSVRPSLPFSCACGISWASRPCPAPYLGSGTRAEGGMLLGLPCLSVRCFLRLGWDPCGRWLQAGGSGCVGTGGGKGSGGPRRCPGVAGRCSKCPAGEQPELFLQEGGGLVPALGRSPRRPN